MIEQDLKSLVMYIQISLNFALDVGYLQCILVNYILFAKAYSTVRGGDFGGEGIVPLKKLDGGDGGAFIPQYLENVLQIYTVKRIRMKEKEDETHVTVIDIYKHYPILFSYIVQHCLD